MRYAIFGDIHGNLDALNTVLENIEKEKPDGYICVGDIVGYGANPNECIERVRALNNCHIVAGNHDLAASGVLNIEFFNDYAKKAITWTTSRLSREEINFLGRLKMARRFDNITAVHSNIYLPELFCYIQSGFDLHMGFINLENSLCFVGHSHVPVIFSLNKGMISIIPETTVEFDFNTTKAFINIGSVGQPRDNNPKAGYAIYTEHKNKGSLELRRVDYPVEKAMDKILSAGLPPILAERLKYGQ